MASLPHLVDLDPSRVETYACCGVTNPAHEGRGRKICWLKNHFAKGLRAKVLLTPENRQCGYVEYLPAEHAWRGVEAPGYLFIHCIWTFYKQYQHRGLGGEMLKGCVEEAKAAGKHGVAVLAREQPWAAGAALYRANGFTLVDTAPPDYSLLVYKFDPAAPDPKFKGEWERKLKRYSRGLTILRSSQCPHIAKFANEIARAAEEEYGLKPRIVELRSAREAQNAPTPYAVFAIVYNGRLLTDHQISLTRFRNIMRKVRAG
jgi:hypothetical protein